MEPTLAALVGLLGGLALGRTPLGSSGHALLERALRRGAAYLLRDRLTRSAGGWAIACVGLAVGAGLVGALFLWAAAIASSSRLMAVAPITATALVIAVATGSRRLWPLRDPVAPGIGPSLGTCNNTSPSCHPERQRRVLVGSSDTEIPRCARNDIRENEVSLQILGHWLTLLFFYGLLGPAGMLGMESLLIASSAGEPEVASKATDGLLAVLTYIPRRVADVIAAGLSSTDVPPAANPWRQRAAGVAWGVVLAAGLATVFHLSGQHPEAYFKNWEDLAYPHRIAELSRSWQHGVIYPRIYPTFAWGYGYPHPNFYPPAVFFAGAALHEAGLSIARSINVIIWLIVFIGALGVFLLADALAGPVFATLAAVVATAAGAGIPAAIYQTGDLAQALGLAWTPFVLLAARRCCARPRLASALIFALTVAAQALIHNISTALAAGLVALYLVVRGLRHAGAKWALAGGAMGLGLAAFFWLPALAEKNYVLIERVYQQHMTPWSQLIRADWWWVALTHLDLGTALDQVPFAGRSLYLLHTILPPIAWGLAFLLLMGGYRRVKANRRSLRDELFLWTALAVVSYFAMCESAWAWRSGSPLRQVQLPVRVAHLALIMGAALGAVAACELWWRLRSGRAFELHLPIAWFAIYLGAAMLASASRPSGLLAKALLAAPLVLALFACVLKRVPKHGVAAAALVALMGVFTVLAARDRRQELGYFYHPLAAPDRALTAPAYLRWERTMKTQTVGSNVGEYLPRWTAGRKPTACPPRALVGCQVVGRRQAWLGGAFAVRVRRRSECLYGALYYPGWRVLCDGRSVGCGPSQEGLLNFAAPAGTSTIEIRFGETPLRKAADALSLLSAVLMAGVSVVALALRAPGFIARR